MLNRLFYYSKDVVDSQMNIDDNTKRFIINRLKWLGFYMGVSFILLFLLPYPYDFISIFGLLVLVNYLRMRSVIKIQRHGQNKRYIWFNLIAIVW